MYDVDNNNCRPGLASPIHLSWHPKITNFERIFAYGPSVCFLVVLFLFSYLQSNVLLRSSLVTLAVVYVRRLI